MTADDRSQSDLYTELALSYSWASLLLDDRDGGTPTFVIHCEPLEVSQPITRDELRALAGGVIPEALAARLAELGSQTGRPLGEADWYRLRTLAGAGLLALDAAADRAAATGQEGTVALPPTGGNDEPPPGDGGEAAGRAVEVIDLNDPEGRDATDPAGAGDAGGTAAANGAAGDAAAAVANGTASAAPTADGPTDQADLDFKVIARFARRGDGARELLICVGGSERSEHYHITEVDDWRDGILDELVPVVESFHARCVERPINPAYKPAPPPRATGQKGARTDGDGAKGKAREGAKAGANKAASPTVSPAASAGNTQTAGQTPPPATEPAPAPAKPEQFKLLFG